MARPPGSTRAHRAARREELALRALAVLVDAEGAPATLTDLARGAEVSVPTLRHHFDDADGVVRAALRAAEGQGEPHLAALRDPGDLPLSTSVAQALNTTVQGWSQGLGALFAGALTHGLGHRVRGPAVVDHLLEPSLQAMEARLAVHRDRGELPAEVDLRAAALSLLSPVLVALLHQHGLSGARCRPLDVARYADQHAHAWCRGWAS